MTKHHSLSLKHSAEKQNYIGHKTHLGPLVPASCWFGVMVYIFCLVGWLFFGVFFVCLLGCLGWFLFGLLGLFFFFLNESWKETDFLARFSSQT